MAVDCDSDILHFLPSFNVLIQWDGMKNSRLESKTCPANRMTLWLLEKTRDFWRCDVVCAAWPGELLWDWPQATSNGWARCSKKRSQKLWPWEFKSYIRTCCPSYWKTSRRQTLYERLWFAGVLQMLQNWYLFVWQVWRDVNGGELQAMTEGYYIRIY